jgi:hypothetical protein
MAVDGTPFLVQAVYSFKGKNNDEVITYMYMVTCAHFLI